MKLTKQQMRKVQTIQKNCIIMQSTANCAGKKCNVCAYDTRQYFDTEAEYRLSMGDARDQAELEIKYAAKPPKKSELIEVLGIFSASLSQLTYDIFAGGFSLCIIFFSSKCLLWDLIGRAIFSDFELSFLVRDLLLLLLSTVLLLFVIAIGKVKGLDNW